jgi:hypothetical protein
VGIFEPNESSTIQQLKDSKLLKSKKESLPVSSSLFQSASKKSKDGKDAMSAMSWQSQSLIQSHPKAKNLKHVAPQL